MKKASSIMYLLGRIFEIVEVVVSAFMLFVGIVAATRSEEIYQKIVEAGSTDITGPEQVKQIGIGIVVCAVVAIVLGVVVLTLLAYAKHAVEEAKEARKLHIAMIVFGVCTNLFILLGGAFALGAEQTIGGQQKTAEPEQKE